MKKTLTTSDIVNALTADENARWTRAGAHALAEHLEQLEADCGIEMELDIVALRCEYSEYESLEEWLTDYYDDQLEDVLDGTAYDEAEEKLRDYIHDRGQLIEFSGGIIVSEF